MKKNNCFFMEEIKEKCTIWVKVIEKNDQIIMKEKVKSEK